MTQRICSIAECGKFVQARGWCAQHYMRWRKHGDVETVLSRPGRAPGSAPSMPCSGPECLNLVGDGSQTGLCRTHIAQVRRGAEMTPIQPWSRGGGFPTDCAVPGCDRPHSAKGMCKVHRQSLLRGSQPKGPVITKVRRLGCAVDECDGVHTSSGYCGRHYNLLVQRFARYGITREFADELLAKQGKKCAVCRREATLSDLAIDHDHDCCPKGGSCGRCVRGLLCGLCNLGLGSFRDDADVLAQAIAYLRETKTQAD